MNRELLSAELDNHYELLAEPVQTVMRKYDDIKDPYEKLKEFTRGKAITQSDYISFVQSIEGMPEEEKKALSDLTPQKYLGYAVHFAKSVKDY